MTKSEDNGDEQSVSPVTKALIDELRRVADLVGQPPTKSEFDTHSEHNPQTYVSEFGSWVDALEAAELDPSKAQGGRKKVTRGDLIAELERVEEEVGRTPQVADMDSQGGYSSYTYKKRFGSWTAALEEVGMKSETVQEVTNNELIEELQALAEELGHPPRTEHMDQKGAYSSTTYQSRFGGWQNALEKAGFDSFKRISDEELIESVKELAAELGRSPTTKEFNELTSHSATTCKERFGSWSATLETAGLDPDNGRNKEYTEDELVEELQRLDDEREHTPSSNEMDDDGEYSSGVYQDRFGSWDEALEAAEIDSDVVGKHQYTDEQLEEELQRIKEEVGNQPRSADIQEKSDISPSTFISRFGSWEEALEAADIRIDEELSNKQYSNDELLQELVHLADKLGQPPKSVDMNKRGEYSASVYTTRFGSWDEALEAAGLDPEENGDSTQYSDGELVSELHRVKEECGRVPTTTDMEKYGEYSHTTYVSRFGSWNEALEAAGLKSSQE